MCETLFVVLVQLALQFHLIGGRDLIVDSAPILAWRRRDPDAALGHAPHHHARPLLWGYRVRTLLCRGSGLPRWPSSRPPMAMMRPSPSRCWPPPSASIGGARVIPRLDAGNGLRSLSPDHTHNRSLSPAIPLEPGDQENRSSCAYPHLDR